MPFIHVSLQKGTDDAYRQALSRSIQKAMIRAMRIPDDDFFSVTHELDPANFHFDRNYYGVERTERMVFIHFFFNTRAASAKALLFEAVVEELQASPGLRPEDLIMSISETAPENWWAFGRQTNPATGTDARMS